MNLIGESLLSESQRQELESELKRRRKGLRSAIDGLKDAMADRARCDSLDVADRASELETQRRAQLILQHQHDMLREIEAALVRLANNQYGISERTGDPIPYERLKVIPWARSESAINTRHA